MPRHSLYRQTSSQPFKKMVLSPSNPTIPQEEGNVASYVLHLPGLILSRRARRIKKKNSVWLQISQIYKAGILFASFLVPVGKIAKNLG